MTAQGTPLVHISASHDDEALEARRLLEDAVASLGFELLAADDLGSSGTQVELEDAVAAVVVVSPGALQSTEMFREVDALLRLRAGAPSFPVVPVLTDGVLLEQVMETPLRALAEIQFASGASMRERVDEVVRALAAVLRPGEAGTDVALAFSLRDARPAAELSAQLEQAGLTASLAWADDPGRCLAILIGADGLDPSLRAAADGRRQTDPAARVIGVFLPGSTFGLSADDAISNWVDMTVGHDDPVAVMNLVHVVRGRNEPWDVGPLAGPVQKLMGVDTPLTAPELARRLRPRLQLVGLAGESIAPRPAAVWLLEVRRVFSRERVESLDARFVLAGLAVLDQSLRAATDFLDIADLESLLTPFGRDLLALRRPTYRPEAKISRDYWTDEDVLGYDFYADAIKDFILHKDTRPPLVIGIKAPWGAGKTSLMRMVRRQLDPTWDGTTAEAKAGERPLTNGELLGATRRESPEHAADAVEAPDKIGGDTRTTVWFNAWKYQNSEQIWAGLAQAIISEVERRMTRIQRERFWASLNLARVNLAEVRRRIYRLLVERLVPVVGAFLLGAVAALVLGLLDIRIAGGTFAATTLACAAWGYRRWRALLSEEVARSDPALVTDPGYEGRLGFLYLVQTDMARVLGLVATDEKPLVVFIDDLDRCTYGTVAQTIEAINLFLAGDFQNCVFVIAMEPDLVAAHIEVAYKEIFAALADDEPGGDATTLGWRFLEKMVQLPLSLPVPHENQLTAYVGSILGQRRDVKTVDRAQVERYRERVRELRPSFDEIESSAPHVLGQVSGGGDGAAADDPSLVKALEEEFSEALSDADPKVQAIIRRHAGDLSGNPREIKRFVNIFRFYALIQFRRQVRELPAPSYEQVGKLAIMAVRWPHLLSAFARPGSNGDGVIVLAELEQLAAEAGRQRDPAKHWSDGVGGARLTERVRLELVASPDLRELLGREPRVGSAAEGFL